MERVRRPSARRLILPPIVNENCKTRAHAFTAGIQFSGEWVGPNSRRVASRSTEGRARFLKRPVQPLRVTVCRRARYRFGEWKLRNARTRAHNARARPAALFIAGKKMKKKERERNSASRALASCEIITFFAARVHLIAREISIDPSSIPACFTRARSRYVFRGIQPLRVDGRESPFSGGESEPNRKSWK